MQMVAIPLQDLGDVGVHQLNVTLNSIVSSGALYMTPFVLHPPAERTESDALWVLGTLALIVHRSRLSVVTMV